MQHPPRLYRTPPFLTLFFQWRVSWGGRYALCTPSKGSTEPPPASFALLHTTGAHFTQGWHYLNLIPNQALKVAGVILVCVSLRAFWDGRQEVGWERLRYKAATRWFEAEPHPRHSHCSTQRLLRSREGASALCPTLPLIG